MATLSAADSAHLHELLTRGPDHFTAIIAAASALGGVVIAGGISLLTQLVLSRREHERWLADHFLTRKLDVLSAFWVAAAEWHDVIVERHSKIEAGNFDATAAVPLPPIESSCLRALRVAQPFLTDSQFRTFQLLTNKLLMAGLEGPGPPKNEDAESARDRSWNALHESYEDAVADMRTLFRHDLLKKMDLKR